MIEQLNKNKDELILRQNLFNSALDMKEELRKNIDKLINDKISKEKKLFNQYNSLFKSYGLVTFGLIGVLVLMKFIGLIPEVSLWMMVPCLGILGHGIYKLKVIYDKGNNEIKLIQNELDEKVKEYINTSEYAHSLGAGLVSTCVSINSELATSETYLKLATYELDFPSYDDVLSYTSDINKENKKVRRRKKGNK